MDGSRAGTALAIVLGIVLDGIPESAVIGLTLLQGGAVGAALLVAVFLSNFRGHRGDDRPANGAGCERATFCLGSSSCSCPPSLLAGYGLFDDASPNTIAFVLASRPVRS